MTDALNSPGGISVASTLSAVCAGLAGAAGVALSAAAAHVDASDFVRAAAGMCLAHAPLLLVLSLPGARARLRWPAIPAAMTVLGLLLFAGDMVRRAFFDASLFAKAAPTGGMLMIGAWLTVAALAAFAAMRRR
ncbi:DUF423 domain-containing protein [Breoghania sp. L-A4]|uniref:DUF423 domain-containing protein n=1 Tax=Breoghania sp. L-A4 TaxID=2304600 RepID=UPI000E35C4ED|nr:DUF423 domain-containing protein [Breoghania sp. L-A4]AXS42110.1 DUF423 domain-containing protein [Breoghania sp. L-A4]